MNFPYLHRQLYPSMKKDGYDPRRPRPGMLRRLVSGTAKDECIAMNVSYVKASSMAPPVNTELAAFESFAGSHLSGLFRLIRAKARSPLTGEMFEVPEEDTAWAYAVKHGHSYYVFKESLPMEIRSWVFMSSARLSF